MEWFNARDVLKPEKINFKNLFFKPTHNDQDKNILLKKHNYTCRTCGGHYKSYLIFTYIQKENIFDLYCGACHNITHLNTGHSKCMDIYYSEMTQIDIIKNTVEYVINNNHLPQPYQLDPKVKTVQISLFEYINLMEHISDDTFKNYKLFFNDNFNTTFITHNYRNMFMEENDRLIEDVEFDEQELDNAETKIVTDLYR